MSIALAPDDVTVLGAALGEVDVALEHLLAATDGELSAADCEQGVVAIERQVRRLAGIRLRILEAARRAEVAQQAGFTGADAWAARRTTSSRADAAKDLALAAELASGQGHDVTAEALDAGLVSADHAAVIVAASNRLPDGLSVEQKAKVEDTLVADAQRLDPAQLRRRARRVLEEVEPDPEAVDAAENEQVRNEEEAARDAASFSMRDNDDGTTTGHFTVPTYIAAFLRKILESMTAPRRMRPGTTDPTGATSPDWRHRRGLAFAELLEHLPTDHLHPKTAATVVVTLDETLLREALKVAGLDTSQTISAGEARRLACNAGILPAVLGTRSVALDLGRANRLFSEAQRLAAGLHHDTCAADGCQRPYAWCELHHRKPWALGGRTDLRDAVPLCHWHHQRIHDHHYLHTYQPDGTIRFRRRP